MMGSESHLIEAFFRRVYYGIRGRIHGYPRQYSENNKAWADRLKKICSKAILEAMDDSNITFNLIDMPYSSEVIGKGLGTNILEQMTVPQEGSPYCLVDVVDGTWGAVSGSPFSGTTTLAVSFAAKKKKEELTLADFQYSAILPHEMDEWFFGEVERQTLTMDKFESRWASGLTNQTNPRQIRFILDLFTTQTHSQLERSIDAVRPIMLEWADFVRLYGAGVEATTMFHRHGIKPSVGAHISANQKMDNVIPLSILIEGAGGIVTDWWNNSLADKKLEDRAFVVMSANKALHDNIMNHFKDVVVIESGVDEKHEENQ